MTCRDVTERLVDLLYLDLGDGECAAVGAHLEECPDCRAAWRELRPLARTLDRWEVPAPGARTERVLVALAIREMQATWSRAGWVGVQHVGAFLLAAAAASGLSLLLTAGAAASASAVELGVAGALWTALYGGVGLLARLPRSRRVVLSGLAATGLSVILTPVRPGPWRATSGCVARGWRFGRKLQLRGRPELLQSWVVSKEGAGR